MMAEAFGVIALGIGMTLLLTFTAAGIGIVLGAPLMLLARSRYALARLVYSTIVHIVRGVPPLVWLFIAFFGMTQMGVILDAVTSAILTLGVIAVANMAEIYRGGLAAIRSGQWEASLALGLSRLDTARDVVFPQLFRTVSPMIGTYVVGLLKDSALASTIGVAEVTFQAGLQTQVHGNGLTLFAFAGLIYLALSLPLGMFSRFIDAQLTRRYAVL
jgi:polar amino acid transport system permease protein